MRIQAVAPKLSSITRLTVVDVILWTLRIVIVLVVIGGTTGTLIKGTYAGHQWFDLLTFGLTMGGVYALIALGFTMVYGVLRQINFAHGAITMAGAFTAYFVASSFDQSDLLEQYPVLTTLGILAVGMVTSAVIAVLVERIGCRPFRGVRGIAPLIATIAIAFFLEQTYRGMFGSGVRAYPDPTWLGGTMQVFGVDISKVQVIVSGAAVITMLVLLLIIQRTRMGMAIRAVSEDTDAAALMGIDVNKVVVLTFALSGGIAGIAGVLYAFVFKQVYFYMGFLPGIKAFAAAVLGGIGSIPGAMIGGLFLGLVESVGPVLFLDGIGITAPYQLRDLIAFTLLIMVLVFRPQGIFGERAVKRA